MDFISPLLRIRIVLVETSHPGNMGAAARAMKTMGITRLFLVRPKTLPDKHSDAMAAGAADVLANAVICANLDDALTGSVLAVAVTARRRDLSHPSMDARCAAVQAIVDAGQGEVALVFGPEMSGLSNEDVLKCQRIAHIPVDADFSSLNLAAAVQVVCYELRMAAGLAELPAGSESPLATFEEVERFYQHMEKTLTEIRFLNADHPMRLMTRVRRIFGRMRMEREEVQILRGVLKMISRAVRHENAERAKPAKPASTSSAE